MLTHVIAAVIGLRSVGAFLVQCNWTPAHARPSHDSHALGPCHGGAQCCAIIRTPQKPKYGLTLLSAGTEVAETTSQEDQAGADTQLPYPRIGDVVRYQGKWKDEIALGEIKNLQFIESRKKWIADVLELKDVGKASYERPKSRDITVEDVETLRPVRAFYVRSDNAFKVMMKGEGKEAQPGYLAEGYRLDGFELPKPVVDATKATKALAEYEALKERLLWDTVKFGGLTSAIAALTIGLERGLVYALGAAGAVSYVGLLEREADSIGAPRNALAKAAGYARFAIAPAVVGALALKTYVQDPSSATLFHLVPKDQFAAAMGGFLASYRLPLIYREIRGAMQPEDLAEMIPGSVGAGSKILQSLQRGPQQALEAAVAPAWEGVPIVVVSGPQGIGREELIEAAMAQDSRLARPVWCTTRPKRDSESEGEQFRFLQPVKFEEMARKGEFLSVYSEGGESYGLREQDVIGPHEAGKTCIVNADVGLIRELMEMNDATLVGVWVSLDSRAALEERLAEKLRAQGLPEGQDFDAQLGVLVRRALEDINVGISTGVFEFTIIYRDQEASLQKLRQAIEYAR